MPFDLQQFQDTFDFAATGNYLPMMQFQAEPIDEDDDVVIYQAVIATQEPNVNNVMLDNQTLRNIAAECNRATAKNDVPIHRLHNAREFQIGVMLTAMYEEKMARTTGTFNISKDDDTEILRTRMRLGIVRDMSPKLIGKIDCNVCDERMFAYGCCINDHWLGETIKVEGKEITVTGTYKDAHVIEVSVVPRGAFPGATLFSENEGLLIEAVKEGALNEKAIHTIVETYSMDMDKFVIPTPISLPEPQPQPNGGPKPVSTPTDADIQLLNNQIEDLTQKVADRDKQLKEKENMVSQTDFAAVETERDEKNAKVIELQGKLGESDATVSEYEACIKHVRDKAIAFYAKVRGVEVTDEKDHLFVSRKKTLQESNSLPFLIGAFEQYMKDFYAEHTEFGGETTHSRRTDETPTTVVNPNHFGNL